MLKECGNCKNRFKEMTCYICDKQELFEEETLDLTNNYYFSKNKQIKDYLKENLKLKLEVTLQGKRTIFLMLENEIISEMPLILPKTKE
jgi:hypothetical protein